MSLILDALKKLERERDAHEPGVLVVGSVPWGTRSRSRLPLALAVLGASLVALVAFALWPRSRSAPPAAFPSPVASARAPVPATPAPPSVPAAVSAPAAPPPGARRLSVLPAVEEAKAPPPGAPAAGAQAPAAASERSAVSGTDDLQLNAISQRDGRPLALINDHLVFEGDSFDGVKILRIGETEVEVEVRGKRRVLRF